MRAAIFDMDGVLVDTLAIHERAWDFVAKANGFFFSHELFQAGNGLTSIMHLERIFKWTNSQDEIRRLAAAKEQAYIRLVTQEGVKPIPGVVTCLQQLRQKGISCAVGTSAPRANLEVVLKAAGLESFFQAFVSPEDIHHSKPAPDIFLKAAEKLHVPPEECIVFEDAPLGIEAARAAGMFSVALTTTHDAGELVGADLVVSTFHDLLLDSLFEK